MHWPQAFVNINDNPDPRYDSESGEPGQGHYMAIEEPSFNETWAQMEKLLETGKVKAIGVSNFSVKKCVLFFFFVEKDGLVVFFLFVF